MAQHDYNIEDQNGFDFLVDLNNALSAIATNNAGPSEPNPTFANMLWFDTNNDLMKMRNEANSAWVNLGVRVIDATGSAPLFACRAWVNFNGTGTVAIRASGNVSSITDNGTGDYTINFTTALPDANYAMVQGSANVAGALNSRPVIAGFNIDAAPTSSAARIYVKDGNNDATDSTRVTLSFFR